MSVRPVRHGLLRGRTLAVELPHLAATVEFRALGSFEAVMNGERVPLGGPRQRSVLARLMVARGRVVPTERIIDDLWQGQPPPSALATIHAYISNLRRALEAGRDAQPTARLLVTVSPGYMLRTADVDAWRFEELVQQGVMFLGADDAVAAAGAFDEALALWQGSAYQEFATAEWAMAEIARLDELHATAIEQRAASIMRQGMAAAVVADLRTHVAAHPLREEGWRLLALALYRVGRQGDALMALREARRILAEELGIDPSQALQRLEADILAQTPELEDLGAHAYQGGPAGWPDEAWPSEESGVPQKRLYGREEQIAALMDDRMRLALVCGEAGMGKSALVEEVGIRLTGQGRRVVAGRCPEIEGTPAGWPWAEICRSVVEQVAPDEGGRVRLPAALIEACGLGADEELTAGRFPLRKALALCLAEASRTAPLVIVLEDLHRADDETIGTLLHLAAELRETRTSILVTYREDDGEKDLSGLLAALARLEPLRITLPGLDTTMTGKLLRDVCGSEVSSETVATVFERTGGNPFFVREIARMISMAGEAAATSEVPKGVHDVLCHRLARIPASVQTVLREAAVIGREIDVDILTEVHDGGEDAVVDAVDAALAAGLVVEPRAGRLRFAHALVRDLLYEGMSRLRRSRTHARVGAAMEHVRPTEVAALAHHFAYGAVPGKAAHYSALAAEQAEHHYVYLEAATLWGQALKPRNGDIAATGLGPDFRGDDLDHADRWNDGEVTLLMHRKESWRSATTWPPHAKTAS
ncbi:BTAD domain-containing putative transcriptional regulator [Streptosporangium sp. NPDC002544]|uniref:BTAD domain-containing putative transcriptional regulator n=1 Tax=Streptosporangium sp. NPDC002544 TaxID=3154538 RepID=UPI0033217521